MNRYSIIRNIDTVVTALRKAKRAGLGGVVDCEYATMRSDPSGATKVFLQSCLEYATANVPYYRGRSAMLSDFPRLRKDEIRTYFEQLQATDRSMRQGVVENTSGGSTGVPVKLLQDAPYQRNVGRALRYFYEEMIGCEIASVRKLMIWGSERDILNWSGDWSKKLKGLKSRTVYVNAFSLTPSALEQIVNALWHYRPELVRGYASSLRAVAEHLRARRIRFRRPRYVVSSAERLTPETRDVVEEVFGCKVFDLYGSREAGAIAGECRKGALHCFTFNHEIEVLDNRNEPVPSGAEGDVIVTTLHNRIMPLVRYEIGDRAVRGECCPCGCVLPTLTAVVGRTCDNFITAEGNIVHGEYFTHLFYGHDWVDGFQVVQEDRRHVTANVRVRDGYDIPGDEVRRLEGAVKAAMGPTCGFKLVQVDQIAPTPQGKRLYTISRVR